MGEGKSVRAKPFKMFLSQFLMPIYVYLPKKRGQSPGFDIHDLIIQLFMSYLSICVDIKVKRRERYKSA